MAQSNNLQREPSMEEILASIRRIIEDSDTSRKAGDDPAGPADAAPAADSDNIHAFRLGLHEDRRDAGPRPTAAAEGFPPLQPWQPDAPQAGAAPAGNDASSRVPDFLGAAGPKAEAEAKHGPDEIEMELSLDDFSTPADIEVDEAQPGAPPSPAGEPRAPIVSERAGRQVAASFGELSAAFEARSRKSFDAIAEEMMRPMLQDWLDNNLPHLVERLVREEIERIARGAAATR